MVGEGQLKEITLGVRSFWNFKISHLSASQRNRTSEENTLVVGRSKKKLQFLELTPSPLPTPWKMSKLSLRSKTKCILKR
jgi:hypothetical protein